MIAVVGSCAITMATIALLPPTELSVSDLCEIDSPIQKLKSTVQARCYWIKQLQVLGRVIS